MMLIDGSYKYTKEAQTSLASSRENAVKTKASSSKGHVPPPASVVAAVAIVVITALRYGNDVAIDVARRAAVTALNAASDMAGDILDTASHYGPWIADRWSGFTSWGGEVIDGAGEWFGGVVLPIFAEVGEISAAVLGGIVDIPFVLMPAPTCGTLFICSSQVNSA